MMFPMLVNERCWLNDWNLPADFVFDVENSPAATLFRAEEWPELAQHVAALVDFVGETANGGHAGYLENNDRWRETPGRLSDLALEACRVLDLPELAASYRRFLAIAETNAAARGPDADLAGYWAAAPEGFRTRLEAASRRHAELGTAAALIAAISQATRRQPDVRVVSSNRFALEAARAALAHPNRAARLATARLTEPWRDEFTGASPRSDGPTQLMREICDEARRTFRSVAVPFLYDGSFSLADRPTVALHVETSAGLDVVAMTSEFAPRRARGARLRRYPDRTVALFSAEDRREILRKCAPLEPWSPQRPPR